VEISDKVKLLYDKDSTVTYANLLELEEISENENTLYPYLDEFISMLKSEKYSIRVRGFRLLCKQAKWDIHDKIDEAITGILFAVNDEKPTAVRLALHYLTYIVLNKRELVGIIKEAVLSMDCARFKDTMRPLIEKDIQALMKVMDTQETRMANTSKNVATIEATVIQALASRGLTLATAESCTGGLIAKRLTDVAGASRAFLGGAVVYTNAVKTALAGVPSEVIAQFGVVSAQVANALAAGIRDRLGADLGIGVTGVAGPGADDDDNAEGLVFVALASEDGIAVQRLELNADRNGVRADAATHALEMVAAALR